MKLHKTLFTFFTLVLVNCGIIKEIKGIDTLTVTIIKDGSTLNTCNGTKTFTVRIKNNVSNTVATVVCHINLSTGVYCDTSTIYSNSGTESQPSFIISTIPGNDSTTFTYRVRGSCELIRTSEITNPTTNDTAYSTFNKSRSTTLTIINYNIDYPILQCISTTLT